MNNTQNNTPRIDWHAAALYVCGMACFFGICIAELMHPPIFFAPDGPVTGSVSFVFFLVALAAALVYLLLRAYGHLRRSDEFRVLLVILVLLALVRAARYFWGGAASIWAWAYVVVLAVALVFLGTTWAGICDFFDGRELRVLIPVAMLLSILVGVGARVLGAALVFLPGTVQSVFPFLCGVLGAVLHRMLSVRATRGAQEPEYGEFNPTGVVNGSKVLRVACVALLVSILGTSLFIASYSEGLSNNALAGSGQVYAIIVLACAMIGMARLAELGKLRFHFVLFAFLFLSVVVLNAGTAFYVYNIAVAKYVLLPIRACSVYVMWLTLEEYCRESDTPFASCASFFFPSVLLAKVFTVVGWTVLVRVGGVEAQNIVVMSTLLVTSLVLMCALFGIVRHGFPAKAAPGVGGGTGATAGAGAVVGARAATGVVAGAASATGGRVAFDGDNAPRVAAVATGETSETAALERMRADFGLSKREFDVLQLTVRGFTQKGMSEELFLSVNSIATYTKTLHAKLGVHSRQEIVDMVRTLSEKGR